MGVIVTALYACNISETNKYVSILKFGIGFGNGATTQGCFSSEVMAQVGNIYLTQKKVVKWC